MTEPLTSPATLAARAGQAFQAYRDDPGTPIDDLVRLVTPILWHCARGQGLDEASAGDVVQTAWMRLVERASTIADPQAVLGWLLSTTRREAWRVAAAHRRARGELDERTPATTPDPAAQAGLDEQSQVLWAHVSALSERCRALLRVIAHADRPDYALLSEALGMPVGSIGPTRGRCLAKLRAALAADPRWETAS
ncbi:MAG: sigma-70 family RNA polymerase sigma factor [Propioniciclava sp.]|uniref:RNA polymerase sigma factor n=1 Tax=Propioniciclava sp. TaxID=2038686 RepID=UPI0039E6AF62